MGSLRPWDYRGKCYMDRSVTSIYLQPFMRYSCISVASDLFSTVLVSEWAFFNHILLSHGYAPGTIAVNVTWIEREFNACQTPRSMYPSILCYKPSIQHSRTVHCLCIVHRHRSSSCPSRSQAINLHRPIHCSSTVFTALFVAAERRQSTTCVNILRVLVGIIDILHCATSHRTCLGPTSIVFCKVK